MTSVAIITARGGSKRIPRKNIKEFCGKPIIAYSITTAKDSGLFDEVMVSTDDEEIAAVSRSYGATVPFMRSAKTSDDYATTEDVLEEVIQNYIECGKTFKWFACLYPTAPLIDAERLKEAFHFFENGDADILEPVVAFSYPPQRGYVLNDGYLEYKWPQFEVARSQDLEPFFHDAGQFYFFRTGPFLKMRKEQIPLKKVPLILEETEVQDIDNLSDWELAEMKYRMRWQGKDVR